MMTHLAVATSSSSIKCIYCLGPVGKVKKGEHIIPHAIGGTLSLRTVCRKCNGSFSEMDRELCSRPYWRQAASRTP